MTKAANEARILSFDIETRPSLAYVWSLWDQMVPLERLIEQGEIISFAAKWYGKRNVEFSSVYHDGKAEMLRKIWDLVDQADVIVHYNGRKFDFPWLRTEWLLADMESPSPVRQVDLLQTVKTFKFASNKLEHISKQLKLADGKGKLKHTGFQLWIDCMANDPAAWELMKRYNVQDVILTEQLYTKLRGWIASGHPNVLSYSADALDRTSVACNVCASSNYQKRGPRSNGQALYQQYKCNDCGHWFKGARMERGTNTVTRSIGIG